MTTTAAETRESGTSVSVAPRRRLPPICLVGGNLTRIGGCPVHVAAMRMTAGASLADSGQPSA